MLNHYMNSITVYRGINLKNPDEIKIFKTGITSTTYSNDMALNFIEDNCCMLKITIPAGSKILDIGNLSYFPEEKEVLISNVLGTFKIIDTCVINKIININMVYIPNDAKKFNPII